MTMDGNLILNISTDGRKKPFSVTENHLFWHLFTMIHHLFLTQSFINLILCSISKGNPVLGKAI